MSLNKVVVVKGMPNDNWHIIIPRGPLCDLKWVWSICICKLRYRKKLNHNILKYVTLSIDLVSKTQHWKRFVCTTIEKMLLCKRL